MPNSMHKGVGIRFCLLIRCRCICVLCQLRVHVHYIVRVSILPCLMTDKPPPNHTGIAEPLHPSSHACCHCSDKLANWHGVPLANPGCRNGPLLPADDCTPLTCFKPPRDCFPLSPSAPLSCPSTLTSAVLPPSAMHGRHIRAQTHHMAACMLRTRTPARSNMVFAAAYASPGLRKSINCHQRSVFVTSNSSDSQIPPQR